MRLDLFGDVLDGARRFDPATQRTTEKLEVVELAPVSEVILDEAAITAVPPELPHRVRRRRHRRSALRGGERRAQAPGDRALAAVLSRAAGNPVRLPARGDGDAGRPDRRQRGSRAGRGSPTSTRPAASRCRPRSADGHRLQARRRPGCSISTMPPGTPPPPGAGCCSFHPLPQATGPGVIDAGGRIGRNFAPERQQEKISLFGALADHIRARMQAGAGGRRLLFRGRARTAGRADRGRGAGRDDRRCPTPRASASAGCTWRSGRWSTASRRRA